MWKIPLQYSYFGSVKSQKLLEDQKVNTSFLIMKLNYGSVYLLITLSNHLSIASPLSSLLQGFFFLFFLNKTLVIIFLVNCISSLDLEALSGCQSHYSHDDFLLLRSRHVVYIFLCAFSFRLGNLVIRHQKFCNLIFFLRFLIDAESS